MSGRLVQVKVVGPLAAYASGFDQELRGRGSTKVSVAQQLRLMAHVSRWLAGQGLDAAALTSERVEAFCAARTAGGVSGAADDEGAAAAARVLPAAGVLSQSARKPASEEERLLARYRGYLMHERGLVEPVVVAWVQAAALFLAAHPGLLDDGGPAVDAGQVSSFCARELPARGRPAAKNLAAGRPRGAAAAARGLGRRGVMAPGTGWGWPTMRTAAPG